MATDQVRVTSQVTNRQVYLKSAAQHPVRLASQVTNKQVYLKSTCENPPPPT